MRIVAKKDVNINGKFYSKGKEIKVNSKEQLIKLNEIGFIEPLTMEEIQNFGKEEKPKYDDKKIKKEE